MKQFSKATVTQINAAIQAMADSAEELTEAIQRFNAALDEHRGDVNDTLIKYNELARDLQNLYAEAHREAQDYFDEQSEKWQEGEAGQEYQAWLDSLEEVDSAIEVFDLDLPDDLEEPDFPDFEDQSWLPTTAPGEE